MNEEPKKDPRPQPSVTLSTDLLLDPTREPLKVILTPYQGITHVPSDLSGGGVGTFVFIELQKCFKRQGYVAEGLMANVIWGFEQCGYDPRPVAAGLTELRKKGYVFYSDASGMPIHELSFNPKTPVWIRYTSKMVNLFVKDEGRIEWSSST